MPRKPSKESHLELRYNTYYAVLYVPKDAVPAIGKTKFSQSTKTGDRHLAAQRAAALVIGWKQQIAVARSESPDPIITSALSLRSYLKTGMHDLAKEAIEHESWAIQKAHGTELAQEFADIATGKQKPLSSFQISWVEYLRTHQYAEKTIDQWSRDIELLIPYFKTANSLTPEKTLNWINYCATEASLTSSSVSRIIGACNNFYRYLKTTGEIPENQPTPFVVPLRFKPPKRKQQSIAANDTGKWLPFKPEEVVELYQTALRNNDTQLSNLIYIAAYTGARIEELCSLKTSKIDPTHTVFHITDSKTPSGIRTVPIHQALKPLIKKLVKSSTDGYLISGLTFNKYGDRSNAIGKRFGRMKKSCGYSDRYVFHSIRKTFTTQLEDNRIEENLAADIVGHDKPRITYGLYSGGASIETMATAVRKVKYKDWDKSTKRIRNAQH